MKKFFPIVAGLCQSSESLSARLAKSYKNALNTDGGAFIYLAHVIDFDLCQSDFPELLNVFWALSITH